MSESLAQAFVRYVHEDLAQVKQPHFDIAWRLAEAKRLGYAEELGYKNIYELAEVEFGLKRSSTKAYIAIDYSFLTSRVGEVAERWQAYSFSQLVEMLPLDYYDRECVQPDWTVKQIRQWRKDHKAVTLEDGTVKFWGELTDKQKAEYEQYKANKQRVDEAEDGIGQTSGQLARSIEEARAGAMVVVSNVRVISHLKTDDDLNLFTSVLHNVVSQKCNVDLSARELRKAVEVLYFQYNLRFTDGGPTCVEKNG